MRRRRGPPHAQARPRRARGRARILQQYHVAVYHNNNTPSPTHAYTCVYSLLLSESTGNIIQCAARRRSSSSAARRRIYISRHAPSGRRRRTCLTAWSCSRVSRSARAVIVSWRVDPTCCRRACSQLTSSSHLLEAPDQIIQTGQVSILLIAQLPRARMLEPAVCRPRLAKVDHPHAR